MSDPSGRVPRLVDPSGKVLDTDKKENRKNEYNMQVMASPVGLVLKFDRPLNQDFIAIDCDTVTNIFKMLVERNLYNLQSVLSMILVNKGIQLMKERKDDNYGEMEKQAEGRSEQEEKGSKTNSDERDGDSNGTDSGICSNKPN